MIGDDGAGPAENVANLGVGRVVEARIIDGPRGERGCHDGCHDDEADARQFLRPAREKTTQGVGQPLIGGRGSAGRAHWEVSGQGVNREADFRRRRLSVV